MLISVLCGAATALQWGLGALALRPVARAIPSHAFAFWFAACNTVLLAVPAAILIADRGLSGRDLVIGLTAGAAEAAATVVYARALEAGEMVVVAPLVSLEGAVAAVIGIIAGATIDITVGVGLFLCVAGGLGVGLPGGLNLHARGAGYAVLSAVFFGIMLWLVGGTETNTVILVFLLSAFSGAALGIAYRSGLHPRAVPRRTQRFLLLAALLNIGGLLAYSLGAHSGSLPVTAVLAAQFAVPAVIGGYLLHHERLNPSQLAGAVVLVVGVGLLVVNGQ